MPRSGPQRSKCSISTVFRVLYYPPRSVLQSPWWPDVLLVAVQSSVVPGSRRSPGKRRVGKRGPRSRGGAAATERTSAQQVFHRYSVRGSLKTSALPAAESLVTRCPFGCRPGFGGSWIPAFAGKTMGERENDEGAALECPSDLIGADGAAALAQGQALLHDFPPGLDGELVEPGLVGHEPGQGLLVELGGGGARGVLLEVLQQGAMALGGQFAGPLPVLLRHGIAEGGVVAHQGVPAVVQGLVRHGAHFLGVTSWAVASSCCIRKLPVWFSWPTRMSRAENWER